MMVMSEVAKLVEQVSPNLSSEAIKKLDQPAVAVQFVKKGTDGSLEASQHAGSVRGRVRR